MVFSHTQKRILFNVVRLYEDFRRKILWQFLLSVGSFKYSFQNVSPSRQFKHSNKYTSTFTHEKSAEILYIRIFIVPIGVLCNIWNVKYVNRGMMNVSDTSFPTPMEEPKKILRCHYVGSDLVAKPTGRF